MGLLWSVINKFRKKKTTKETLIHLEEEIERLESTIQRNQELQKTVVLFLLGISTLIYLSFVAIFYLWYMPKKWSDRFLWIVPFVLFPFLVFFLKKILHYVFVTRISGNVKSLELKKKEKKKILENVLETETYKVAKELLEKFDPGRKLVEREKPDDAADNSLRTPGPELRKRPANDPTLNTAQHPPLPTPMPTPQPLQWMRAPALDAGARATLNGYGFTPSPMPGPRPGTPLIRPTSPGLARAPILPSSRSFFDKVAEYFVGDGPNNRFALICIRCFCHNGMVLAEEFEYTAYRCCYCGELNPARKVRPSAPVLEQESLSKSVRFSTATHGSTDASSSESESESSKPGDDNGEKNESGDQQPDSEVLTEADHSSEMPVETKKDL